MDTTIMQNTCANCGAHTNRPTDYCVACPDDPPDEYEPITSGHNALISEARYFIDEGEGSEMSDEDIAKMEAAYKVLDAAPDLLAALEGLASAAHEYQRVCADDPLGEAHTRLWTAIEESETAIAAAKGE